MKIFAFIFFIAIFVVTFFDKIQNVVERTTLTSNSISRHPDPDVCLCKPNVIASLNALGFFVNRNVRIRPHSFGQSPDKTKGSNEVQTGLIENSCSGYRINRKLKAKAKQINLPVKREGRTFREPLTSLNDYKFRFVTQIYN